MSFELFTVATKETPGFKRLRRSLERFRIPLTVLCSGREFPGFGWRFKEVVRAIRSSSARFVVHCDAFDTVCLSPMEALLWRFQDYDLPILFSSEAGGLNPGLFVAEREAFIQAFDGRDLEELFPHHFNDMFQLQFLWQSEPKLFGIDESKQCFFTQGANTLVLRKNTLLDASTGVAPCFMHAPNGGSLEYVDEWLYG